MGFWKKIWSVGLELLLPNRPSAKQLENLTTTVFKNRVGEINPTLLADLVLFPYRQPLAKAVIWELKYHRHPDAIRLIAELLTEEIYAYIEEIWPLGPPDNIILIPIPLSEIRERERGYNQVSLVLEKLSPELSVINKGLIRYHTPSQTSQTDKVKRQKNIVGSFVVADKTAIAGKIIFLIDDVVTTGSTLAEAKKTLLEAGAKQIITVAFAH